mmetsp:Transcript_93717/g.264565  ORF Transcript_93717/g.264565 Transcript_93717/m.264565 type:complete len:240 (-) Transcript_93717:251-970(-)
MSPSTLLSCGAAPPDTVTGPPFDWPLPAAPAMPAAAAAELQPKAPPPPPPFLPSAGLPPFLPSALPPKLLPPLPESLPASLPPLPAGGPPGSANNSSRCCSSLSPKLTTPAKGTKSGSSHSLCTSSLIWQRAFKMLSEPPMTRALLCPQKVSFSIKTFAPVSCRIFLMTEPAVPIIWVHIFLVTQNRKTYSPYSFPSNSGPASGGALRSSSPSSTIRRMMWSNAAKMLVSSSAYTPSTR